MNRSAVTVLCGSSLALSLGAFLWLLLWPDFYRGVEVVSVPALPALGGVTPPPSTVEVAKMASLLEVNGWTVVPKILLPVALSGLGLAACLRLSRTRWLLYANSLLLGAFCLISAFSVGLFYVPAAVALAVAALLGRRAPTPKERLLG